MLRRPPARGIARAGRDAERHRFPRGAARADDAACALRPAAVGARGRAFQRERDGRGADPRCRDRLGHVRRRRPRSARQPAGGLLALHAASSEARWSGARRPRPDAVRGRVLVQGRVPERVRLQAGLRVRAGAARRPRDRLSREGLRELPAAAAGPDGARRARMEGAQPGRPRRRARRAAGVHGGRAELRAGRRRDRGVPRHGAASSLRPPPRDAARLSDARRLERSRVRPSRGPGIRGGHDPGRGRGC